MVERQGAETTVASARDVCNLLLHGHRWLGRPLAWS